MQPQLVTGMHQLLRLLLVAPWRLRLQARAEQHLVSIPMSEEA